jgi:hypothetical protein
MNEEPTSLLKYLRETVAAISSRPHGRGRGIKINSASALGNLASEVLNSNAAYKRGATFDNIRRVVSIGVMKNFVDRDKQTITELDVALIGKYVSDWFAKAAVDRRVFIACDIVPCEAAGFSIGPVSFHTIGDFLTRTYHFPTNAKGAFPKETLREAFQPAVSAMQNDGPMWVAEVLVLSRGRVRSRGP